MDIEALREVIADYRYGQFSILSNGMTLRYNPRTKTALCNPYYHWDPTRKDGTCEELANTAYYEIRVRLPELQVFRATGFPASFFHICLVHHFLVVTDKAVAKPGNEIITTDRIDRKLNRHSVIVDPSFHLVRNYESSGYSIETMFSPGFPRECSKSALLRYDEGIHLCDAKKREIILFGLYFHENDILRIAVQQDSGEIECFPLSSKKLDKRFSQESTVMLFLEFLRGINPIETTEELKATIDTVIR
jgi:hypothetical protein